MRSTATVAVLVAFAGTLMGVPPAAVPHDPAAWVDQHHGASVGEDEQAVDVSADVHADEREGIHMRAAVRPGGGDSGAGDPSDPGGQPPEGGELPNLRPLPPTDIRIDNADGPMTAADQLLEFADRERIGDRPRGLTLRFALTIENVGAQSLELVAVPGPPDPERRDVLTSDIKQCVAFAASPSGTPALCTEYADVVRVDWHPYHAHLHLPGFARYELRSDIGGRRGEVLRTGVQSGWCLSDRDRARNASSDQASNAWYVGCGAEVVSALPVHVRHGISPGWAHRVDPLVHGQQIPIEGLPDGPYWLTVVLNPPEIRDQVRLRESHLSDNVVHQRILIRGNGLEAVIPQT